MLSIWDGKIVRKTVKRGVMTTPYGVTQEGMRRQLMAYLESLHAVDGAQAGSGAISYLVRTLGRRIDRLVPEASNVMDWLKEVTDLYLTTMGEGMIWTTPAGLPIVVEEYKDEVIDVTYSLRVSGAGEGQEIPIRGSYRKRFESESNGIDPVKQQSKIAPNFIHSLDAAHMMLSIERMKDAGLNHFLMIHDCFGVHAADVDEMVDILRDEFVEMHQHPWLQKVIDEQLATIELRYGEEPESPEIYVFIEALRQYRNNSPTSRQERQF